MPFRSTYRKQNGVLVPYASTSGLINPFGADCSALLQGNGTNGSTTFRDEVGNTWSITHGLPSISTAQSKFGGSSITFPSGTTSRISTASHARFGFGTGDFTIGGWFYQIVGAGVQVIVDTRTASNTGIAVYCSGNNLAVASNTANMAIASVAHAYSAWHYFEVNKSGTTLYGSIDGAPVFSGTDSRTYASASQCFMGWDYGVNSDQSFSGFMNSIFVIKGRALHTGAAFSVPTEPPRL